MLRGSSWGCYCGGPQLVVNRTYGTDGKKKTTIFIYLFLLTICGPIVTMDPRKYIYICCDHFRDGMFAGVRFPLGLCGLGAKLQHQNSTSCGKPQAEIRSSAVESRTSPVTPQI